MVEVGDILLCVVDKISGPVVFVKLPDNKEGSIVLSEIAPGRIRNLRDYVFPGKNIVCKVLRVNGERIDLSLRRVTPKEIKDLRDSLSAEKSSISLLKSVLGEKSKEVIEKISKDFGEVYPFLEESKADKKALESLVGKENASKILEIIQMQKKKTAVIKKSFNLSSDAPDGIVIIKDLLSSFKNVEIKYLAAGKYSIISEGEDKKVADNKIRLVFEALLEKSKKGLVEFSFKEK
jgi:translation initiation factor 2 alpha subunit (eIF-2alpha)